jgi:glutamate racemase
MKYLRPLLEAEIDTLVLGCTHYPLLRPAIHRLLGDDVTLVDSAENCAIAVRELLAREDLNASSGSAGSLQVALTDPPDAFLDVAHEALRLDIGEIKLRSVSPPPPQRNG